MKSSNLKRTAIIAVLVVMASLAVNSFARFAGGNGTEEDPYQVETAEHLNNVRGFLDRHFIQTADIDLEEYLWDEGANNYINNGQGWLPIGNGGSRFTGYYDGGGHIVDNLYIDRPTTNHLGFFGYLDQGSIKNLGITNADVKGDTNTFYMGVLVGYNNGTITSCYTTGELLIGSMSGGIAGFNTATVEQCWNACNVTGRNSRMMMYVGGVVGYSSGTVSDCYNTGTVSEAYEAVGGLVGGAAAGSIVNCYNRGRVIGTNVAGGLVGNNDGAAISYCYSTGPVQANSSGGLVGANRGTVTNCYWDVEASELRDSQGGEGKATREMTYPYELATTYIEWDFREVWKDDAMRNVNDGYPILHYQKIGPLLDTPIVKIEVITVDNEERVRLSWEAVEEASSYRIYSSTEVQQGDWGEPLAITRETSFIDDVNEPQKCFYYVVASINEPPGD